VDVDHGPHQLSDVDSSLKLSESFASLGQIFERVVAAVLEQDVDVLSIFEGVDELDDVAMSETLVDLYFDQQFVALPLLVNLLLRYHFGCV
jgi:hypothetical protein